jgi:hypothetical protein
MCADLTVGTGYAGSLTINRSAYIFGSITTANEINVTTAASQTITLASRGTVNLSYGNRTLLDAVINGPTTTNINANLGSPAFNTNKFTVFSGNFNTNGFAIYTSYLAVNTTTNLSTSEIFVYGECRLTSMGDNTASIYLMNSGVISGEKIYNLNLVMTSPSQQVGIGAPSATIINRITDRNPDYPSTQNYNYDGFSTVLTTNAIWDVANGSGRNVFFLGTSFVNNSTQSLQTLTATFTNCTASGTFSGADFNAFGPADLGGNTGITFPSRLKTFAFSGSAAQTFVVPQDFTGQALVTAIGGGANATLNSGGGGGAFAYSVLVNRYFKGQTLFVSSTNSGQDAWINIANVPTTDTFDGVLAKGTTTRNGGSAAVSVGSTKYNGGFGGNASGRVSGAGGGSSATSAGAGFSAVSPASGYGIGGTGGAGISGNAVTTNNENGSAGGNPLGGVAGVGGISNTAGGNATAGSGGGGGGGGASYSVTNTTKTGTYTRASASTTLVLDITNHEMISGQSYQYNFAIPFNSGTYSKPSPSSGAPVTITTSTPHGLTSGQAVYINFISGNAGARDNTYAVTVTGLSTFVVIIGLSTTASGSVNLHPAAPTSTFATTVINPNQVSITTASNCPMPTTNVSATVPIIAYDNAGAAGGSSSYLEEYTYDFLNGVAVSGTIGPAGGGGGGAGSFGFAGGNGGNAGGVGGGGGGRGNSALGAQGTPGTGGPALILFSYIPLPPPSQGYIIG